MPEGDQPHASWEKDTGVCGQKGQARRGRSVGSSTLWDTAQWIDRGEKGTVLRRDMTGEGRSSPG
jgi:hypothetical protein